MATGQEGVDEVSKIPYEDIVGRYYGRGATRLRDEENYLIEEILAQGPIVQDQKAYFNETMYTYYDKWHGGINHGVQDSCTERRTGSVHEC